MKEIGTREATSPSKHPKSDVSGNSKVSKKGVSPYHISNPYAEEMARGEHVAPITKDKSSAVTRIKGPTKESAALVNAFNSAESMLAATGGNNNNQTMDEAYLRSLQSLENKGQSYRVELLTKMYKKAKKKARDLDDAGGASSIPLKVHTQQGSKVYNAISTVLYATISTAKVDQLETYIYKKGSTLPASILDLGKWRGVLDVARMVRVQSYSDNSARMPSLANNDSAINMAFDDGPTVAARPHTADGVFYKGNVLEDDADLESGTAIRNNWMSPGAGGVVPPTLSGGGGKAEMVRFRTSDLKNTHSMLVSSIREDLEGMASEMKSISQQILSVAHRHQKEARDKYEAQLMRTEQLELDLSRAKLALHNEAVAAAQGDNSVMECDSAASASPPSNWAKTVQDQHFVSDAHAELRRQFEELMTAKEESDRELEREREQLAALKTAIGDAKQQEEALQRSVDGESRRAADAESRLRLAEEALRGEREKNARNNASFAEASGASDRLREEHERAVKVLREEVEQQRSMVASLTEHQNEQHRELVTALQVDLDKARQQTEHWKKAAHAAQADREGASDAVAATDAAERASMQQEAAASRHAEATLRAELKEAQAAVAALEHKAKAETERFEALQKGHQDVSERYAGANSELAALRLEHQDLRRTHESAQAKHAELQSSSTRQEEGEVAHLRTLLDEAQVKYGREEERLRQDWQREKRHREGLRVQLGLEEAKIRRLTALVHAVHDNTSLSGHDVHHMAAMALADSSSGEGEGEEKGSTHETDAARRASAHILHEGSFAHVLATKSSPPPAHRKTHGDDHGHGQPHHDAARGEHEQELRALRKRVAALSGAEAKQKQEVLEMRERMITQAKAISREKNALEREVAQLQDDKARQGSRLAELMAKVSALEKSPRSREGAPPSKQNKKAITVASGGSLHGGEPPSLAPSSGQVAAHGHRPDKVHTEAPGGHAKARLRHTVHAAKLISHLFLSEGHKRVIVKKLVAKTEEALKGPKGGVHGHGEGSAGAVTVSKPSDEEARLAMGQSAGGGGGGAGGGSATSRKSGRTNSKFVTLDENESYYSSGADSDDVEYDDGGSMVPPPLHRMASKLEETQNELNASEKEKTKAVKASVERIKMLMERIDSLKGDVRVNEAKIAEVQGENEKLKNVVKKREAQLLTERNRTRSLEEKNSDLLAALEEEKMKEEMERHMISPLSTVTLHDRKDSITEFSAALEAEEKEADDRRSKIASFMNAPTAMIDKKVREPIPTEEGDLDEDEDEDEKGDRVPETSSGPVARSSLIVGGAGSPVTSRKSAVNKAPLVTQTRGTSLGSVREASAVKIQKLIRGFLARVYVDHLTTEKMAEREGIMVAYRGSGTRQGEAGWYVANNQLFYFAMDKGEYVLVCGPVSEAEYDLALSECVNNGTPPRAAYPGEIQIDRMGLVALRLEVARYKRLIEEASWRAGPEGPTGQIVEEVKRELRGREDEVRRLEGQLGAKDALVDQANAESKRQTQLAEDLRRKMKLLQVEATSARDALHVGGGGGMMGMGMGMGMGTFSPGKAPAPSISAPRSLEFAAKLASLSLTAGNTHGIIKLQALARAFVVRSKRKQKSAFDRASSEGILMALKGTKQGHSGWYRAPDGKVFYFILKDEEWVMTAGPLNISSYHDLFYAPIDPNAKGPDFSPIGTPTSSAKKEISSRASRRTMRKRRGAVDKITAHTVLRRANCELQLEHPDLHGDLFVDRSTKNLYMAVNVEQLVKNSVVVDPSD